MTRWVHAPCPKCDSSDAFSYKEDDEWGFCFSCQKSSPIDPNFIPTVYHKENYSMHTLEEIENYDTRGFQERGIHKAVAAHYGVKVSYGEDGSIVSHFYPYTKDGAIVAYKERKLPKTFTTHGNFKDTELFGQNVSTGGKRIIITEGELDALAVAQAQYDKYKRFYPAVALPSASAMAIVLAQREWLREFDEVVLMFDMDEPGQKATQQAAKIIGYDKVKIATLPEKDPCDVLIKHGSDALMQCIFNVRSYSPADVVKGEDIWTQYKLKDSVVSIPYPECLDGLNEKIKGIRMGEIVLFTSGTGSGKSTVIKEIVLELLAKTNDMIGMVSLEESVGDTAEKFIGMKLHRNLNREEVSEEDKYKAFQEVFGDERLVLLDHQGSVSDESLVDKMEHLALMGCKYIILDHITIAVSEGAKGKTGNEAVDSFMSDLLKITKKHNIWLGVISHLRKSGLGMTPFEEGKLPSLDDIKGSGSIKQIAFDIIGFARDMTNDDVNIRNTIQLQVLKSRLTGLTGRCGTTHYDADTGRLYKKTMVDFA
jgi:twinkle protein